VSHARQVLVLADDITGANDTAVQFARLGWSTYLALTAGGMPALDEDQVVVARSLGTRAADAETAANRTEAAIAEHGRARHVYLKIDSTMRGSVAGQVAGAVRARRASEPNSFVVLCPAYPAMGRTVHDGEMRVAGEPAHRGPAGRDPITPISTSQVTALVPGSVSVSMGPDAGTLATSIGRAARTTTCVAVDAESDLELDRLAQAIVLLGERAMAAGSAGLALALAARWASAPDDRGSDSGAPAVSSPAVARQTRAAELPTLVVVTSQHQVALEQVQATLGALPPSLISSSRAAWDYVATDDATRRWAQDLVVSTSSPIHVVLAPPLEGAHPDAASAGRVVARALAMVVDELVSARSNDVALVLVGGDGASAVLDRLRAEALHVTGALVEGVPVGTIVGGPRAGLTVVTKAGGFGDATTLTQILSKLNPTLVGADQ